MTGTERPPICFIYIYNLLDVINQGRMEGVLSNDAILYCLFEASDRCLEGGRGRNGAPDDFVFTSCQILFAKCRWKEKVKQTERSTMFYGY